MKCFFEVPSSALLENKKSWFTSCKLTKNCLKMQETEEKHWKTRKYHEKWEKLKRFLLLLFYRQFYLDTSIFGKRLDKTMPTPTTTRQQSKYIHQHPSAPTTIHHHPQPAKIYPPPPTTNQNISTTTTTTRKMGHHPAKAKIHSYKTYFCHCFNSFLFFEMQYPFRDGDFVK